MSDKAKINLSLLKKLVSELEKSVELLEGIPIDKEEGLVNYITEVARASGLAGIVVQEAKMLVKDMYTLIQLASGPTPPSESDVIAELDKMFRGGPPGGKHNAN